jgi:DNA polymerase-3 subunit epsilon
LRDTTFVAHNVNFDYKFISIWFEKIELLEMLNRHICTIDLAKRTIKAEKFGLKTLKKYLDIKTEHHRALSDAISTTKIFEYILENLPAEVESVEDLIKFSQK